MPLRILLVLILFAGTLYADVKVLDGRVSADLQSQPLTEVLERLKTQMNMRMVVDDGVAGKMVSARFQDLPVGLALKKLLEGTGINYVVLSGADGEPQSIFIGGSSRPGAPPRRLDNRPVGNRGVVTPVQPAPPPPPPIQPQQPPPPQPQQPQTPVPQPDARPLQPLETKPELPPTGGGFVPDQPEQPPAEEEQPQESDDDGSEDL